MKYALLGVFCFITVSFFMSTFLVKNRISKINYGESYIQLLRPLKFTLNADSKNINIVKLTMKNQGMANSSTFHFDVYSQSNLVRSLSFSGNNVGDPSDLKLQFDPVVTDGIFTFVISSDDYTNPVLINVDDMGDPSYWIYYRTSDKKSAVSSLLSYWKLNFLSNSGFFSLWTCLLLAILVIGIKYEKN